MDLVYITTSSEKEAEKLALALLKKKLVACANIVPKIKSLYWWNGKIEKDSEALLLCKTLKKKEKQIEKLVKQLHSYDCPCIEFVKISRSNREYIAWAESVLK